MADARADAYALLHALNPLRLLPPPGKALVHTWLPADARRSTKQSPTVHLFTCANAACIDCHLHVALLDNAAFSYERHDGCATHPYLYDAEARRIVDLNEVLQGPPAEDWREDECYKAAKSMWIYAIFYGADAARNSAHFYAARGEPYPWPLSYILPRRELAENYARYLELAHGEEARRHTSWLNRQLRNLNWPKNTIKRNFVHHVLNPPPEETFTRRQQIREACREFLAEQERDLALKLF